MSADSDTQSTKGLQNSIIELTMAYDATIEAWTRALDLRDNEPPGHTRRVAEMTVRLAKAFGIAEPDLTNWQRGATLHDIGKMGIPDQILLKTTPLTEEDWVFIHRHPQIAYDLLSPIVLLCPALDIPYYHHEKWDGSGYMFGLKGEHIPFAARVFAVVDVYDALTSDHFYRKAWSNEKALAFIRDQAGRHFDPKVAEAFIQMQAAAQPAAVSASAP